MNFYSKLVRNPNTFLSVAGMHLHTFKELLSQFEQTFLKLECKRKLKTVRTASKQKRSVGGGRTFNNDLNNRALMLLIYYSFYLTQDFISYCSMLLTRALYRARSTNASYY